MDTYYTIECRVKEDPETWMKSSLASPKGYGSYSEACDVARKLVYEERLRARRDKKSRSLIEYRVVEYKSVYIEETMKVFPIADSLFV